MVEVPVLTVLGPPTDKAAVGVVEPMPTLLFTASTKSVLVSTAKLPVVFTVR